jgi:hypothetical protein
MTRRTAEEWQQWLAPVARGRGAWQASCPADSDPCRERASDSNPAGDEGDASTVILRRMLAGKNRSNRRRCSASLVRSVGVVPNHQVSQGSAGRKSPNIHLDDSRRRARLSCLIV